MQLFNKPYDQLNEMELEMFQEEMSKYMATGGIAGLRNGGRPGYSIGELVAEPFNPNDPKWENLKPELMAQGGRIGIESLRGRR